MQTPKTYDTLLSSYEISISKDTLNLNMKQNHCSLLNSITNTKKKQVIRFVCEQNKKSLYKQQLDFIISKSNYIT